MSKVPNLSNLNSCVKTVTCILTIRINQCYCLNKLLAKVKTAVDCVWNVMAHVLETRFRISAKRMSPSAWVSVQSTTGSRGVRISGNNAGYTKFRRSVKSTGYPLHFASFPFISPPVRHHVSSRFNWTLPQRAPPWPPRPHRLDNLRPWSGYTRQLCFVCEHDGHLSASQRCVATRHKWFRVMSPLPRMQLIHYLFNNAVQTSYYTWHVKKRKGQGNVGTSHSMYTAKKFNP
jgi:hypothetical protein